jgi:hypothetical protein
MIITFVTTIAKMRDGQYIYIPKSQSKLGLKVGEEVTVTIKTQ